MLAAVPSRRPEIAMSPEELRAFLDETRVITVATIGPNGRPHLMPLWFVRDGDALLTWTYARSQKVRNLERLPQATVQVEGGHAYHELRGAMLECDVEIVRDTPRVLAVGERLARRYLDIPPDVPLPPRELEARTRQAAKRVVLRFVPTRVVSFDHRKLGAGAGH